MRCITYTGYRSLYKAAAAVAIDPKVPIVWGVEIGTDWVENFHQFLGAEMWCQLGLQILLKCQQLSSLLVNLPWSN